jgi:dihydrofolate reductase
MRKIVAGFAISTDGFIEGPNGEIDWILMDPELNFAELMQRYDTYLVGRISYEKALQMGAAAFADNKTYVFSRTLETVQEPYQLVKDDAQSFIDSVKQQEGKDIAVFGGADLLTSLLQMGVVDEISLSVIPVLLGSGKPFIGMLKNRVQLQFKDAKTYGNGTVILTYKVV